MVIIQMAGSKTELGISSSRMDTDLKLGIKTKLIGGSSRMETRLVGKKEDTTTEGSTEVQMMPAFSLADTVSMTMDLDGTSLVDTEVMDMMDTEDMDWICMMGT